MYFGIDVGGSKIKIASFSSLDHPQIADQVTFKTSNIYNQDLKNIINTVSSLSKTIKGIGIGLPGVLNKEKTMLINANNLRDWDYKNVKADLQKKFGCQVELENDATAAAIGEALYGAGVGKDFLFITWGTGIGGAFVKILNGRVYAFFSEPGHHVLKENGLLDTCGQKGCLEAYCGRGGIKSLYKKPAKNLDEKEWQQVEKDFALGLLNLVAIYPVEWIIFSGTIALRQKARLTNIQKLLAHNLKIVTSPKIILSKLGVESGVYGAAALLKIRQ